MLHLFLWLSMNILHACSLYAWLNWSLPLWSVQPRGGRADGRRVALGLCQVYGRVSLWERYDIYVLVQVSVREWLFQEACWGSDIIVGHPTQECPPPIVSAPSSQQMHTLP